MLSSTQPVSFEYLPDHLVSQAAWSLNIAGDETDNLRKPEFSAADL